MQQRSVMVNRTLATIAYGACAISTASAEVALAHACGFGSWISWCLPAALDVYVLVALRTGRDVAFAVGVLLAVVISSHLVSTSLLEVSRWVVIGVSSVAPLLLWRVHGLLTGHGALPQAPALQEGLEAVMEAVRETQEEPEPAPLEPLQETPALPRLVQENLQNPSIDRETLQEKLTAGGLPLPSRSSVIREYGVSEWDARKALQAAQEDLQGTTKSSSLTKENV